MYTEWAPCRVLGTISGTDSLFCQRKIFFSVTGLEPKALTLQGSRDLFFVAPILRVIV